MEEGKGKKKRGEQRKGRKKKEREEKPGPIPNEKEAMYTAIENKMKIALGESNNELLNAKEIIRRAPTIPPKLAYKKGFLPFVSM